VEQTNKNQQILNEQKDNNKLVTDSKPIPQSKFNYLKQSIDVIKNTFYKSLSKSANKN